MCGAFAESDPHVKAKLGGEHPSDVTCFALF